MFQPYKTILRQLLIDWNCRTASVYLHAVTARRHLRMYAQTSLTLLSCCGAHAVFLLCVVHLLIHLLGGGVQLGPLSMAATDWPIVACPRWLWWRIWWNEDWQDKLKYSEKTRPSATLSTTNPTWPDPGSNPGCRGEKPVTNRLSYGAAYLSHLSQNSFWRILIDHQIIWCHDGYS
jgi:hypothetical protein